MWFNFSSELDETAINLSLKCKVSVEAVAEFNIWEMEGQGRAEEPENTVDSTVTSHQWALLWPEMFRVFFSFRFS